MSNSVGSLNQQQKELILGCLLGDGYIRKINNRQNAFLEINHSIKAKDYVDWKYEILKNLVLSKPKIRFQNKNFPKQAYRFFTRQHPFFTELWKKFYFKKGKIIPKDFKITPFILAIWYMDDGSKTNKNDVYLNCQQFDLKSQKRLLHQLRLFKIKARINKDKKYFRIRIKKESLKDFFQLIKPYIHPSMKYKLLIDDPVETASLKKEASSPNTES